MSDVPIRGACPDCKQVVMFRPGSGFAVSKTTMENRPCFKCESCGALCTDQDIRAYQETVVGRTPKDVADYFQKMTGGRNAEKYAETLVTTFLRQVVTYLLIEFLRRVPGEPEEYTEKMLETWRAAVKKHQAMEARMHAEMAETPLGKMLSERVGDGEDARLFMKEARDKAEEHVKNQLQIVAEAVRQGREM